MEPTSWQRAKRIIEQALTRHGADRDAYVRAECGDDGDLFELIQELLANYTPQSAFLEQPPTLDDVDPLADLQPGTRIAQYTILDRLGRGGMGQVFLCSDRELGRKVALKCLISSGQGAAEDRDRILREAKAAAAINHHNVASIHHVIEQGDRAFIVMEYVHGENLATVLKRGRLPVQRVVDIARELASALAAAHAKGVIHRDLKPANVQLESTGGVKVLDFGVAKSIAVATSVSSGASTTVRAGAGAGSFSVAHGGTLPYMSPEQLRGQSVDERSDVFSLGVVMFEMACGRRPFLGDDVAVVAAAQAEGAPDVTSFDPTVPRALGDVIARALAVDVRERFQTAAHVETALDGLLTRSDERRQLSPIVGYAARVAAAVAIAPLVVTLLGFLSSTALNTTLGRVGPHAMFGHETWTDYLYWGVHSLIAPTIYLILGWAALTAAALLVRLLALVPPVGLILRWFTRTWHAFVARADLHDPVVLAQTLASLAIVTIIIVVIAFKDFIGAWISFIDSAPAEVFEPIQWENDMPRAVYRVLLTVLIGAFGAGLYRVLALRRRRRTERGFGTVVVLCAATGVMVLLVQLPHRILFRADFERVDLGRLHCYNIGESGDSMLIYCPQTAPPRNHVVKKDDPSLTRLGIVESIFQRTPSTRSGF